MKKAFTLIELLVVVLIIGILAALALPKYNKAVEKSRIAEALINLKAIADANRRYFLTNDVYAVNITDLDIQPTGQQVAGGGGGNYRIQSKYFTFSPYGQGTETAIALAQRNPAGQEYFLIIYPDKKGIKCYGYSQNGKDICNELAATNPDFYK